MFVTSSDDNKLYMNAPGTLISNIGDLKAKANFSWAEESIYEHEGIGWILANYVEADRPNQNGHMWTFEDLVNSQHTIKHMPMNVLHNDKNVVGTWVNYNMIYPLEVDGRVEHPYTEVLGALWIGQNPDIASVVEKYYAEGSLFVSMECICDTVTIRADDREETYPWKGVRHESYGDIQNIPGATFQLNRPTFVGGALIFPPVMPGWRGANVTALAREAVGDDIVDQVIAGIRNSSEDLSEETIENVAVDFLMKRFQAVAALVEGLKDEKEEVLLINEPSEPNIDTKDKFYDPQGGVEVMDELETAKATIADLKARVNELETDHNAAKVEAKIAELSESHDAALEEIKAELEAVKAELDNATLKAAAEETRYNDVVAYLEAVHAAEVEAATAAARKDERVALVKEVASFSQDYVEKRSDEWAALSDEDFGVLVEDLKATAAAVANVKVDSDASDTEIPKATAMDSGASDDNSNDTSYESLFKLMRTGVDPRAIR